MRCRIAEDEDEASGAEKVRATLAEHILDDDERGFVEPRILQLLGWGGEEQGERQQLFAAWRLFFERLAAFFFFVYGRHKLPKPVHASVGTGL